MTVTNYYLVDKETKKVVFLFKLNPNFLSKDGSNETWLAGKVYRSDLCHGLTLDELYALDYSEDYWIPNLPTCDDYVFYHYADVDYASYKGYRLFQSGKGLAQTYDDFGGNDLIEMNAFLATLFMQFIGPEEVSKWDEGGNFVDKYGVNELVMKNFTIESDHNEDVFYHNSLINDYEKWEGFRSRT